MRALAVYAAVFCAVALLALTGCPQMPKAHQGALEIIEASELAAQQAGASITNLTCTKFRARQCIEPGKAIDPDVAAPLHAEVQKVRTVLRQAAVIGAGQVGDCFGEAKTQSACIATARLWLNALERQILEAQLETGGAP